MKKTFVAASVAIALGAVVGTALAQAKPEVLVKQRQAAMTLIGKYFGPLGGMAQGKAPFDAKIVQRNAGYLATLTQLPWDGFHASTKGEKSNALPEVYSNPDKFKEAAERLQSEVKKLQSVANGGDEAATKAQIGATGKACGGCHDNFRKKQ